MSDQTHEVQEHDMTAPSNRQALIDAAWDSSTEEVEASELPGPTGPSDSFPTREEASAPPKEDPAPLTKEALEEKVPSAAKSIREFLQEQAGPREPEGLEKEVVELRAALDAIRQAGKAPEPEKSESQAVLDELKRFREAEAQRVQEAQEAAAKAAQQERIEALRQGASANLKANEEKYPALFALEQQDTVITELFARLQNNEDASEDTIASEAEAGLWEVYEKLHAIKTGGKSNAPPARSESQTISNALAGADDEPDTSKMTRQELIEYAWQKAQI
jgi:hypothetical protein